MQVLVSFWSYAGFSLIIILIGYLIVRLGVYRLRAVNQLLEKTINDRTKEIADKNYQLEMKNEEIRTIHEKLNLQKEKLKTALDSLCATRAQLIESEKMAALGGLVAGVAHEINTPVGIGITAVSNLKEEIGYIAGLYKKDEISRNEFKDFLDSATDAALLIQKNLERTADLIQGFKQVSADQASEKQRVFKLRSYLEDIIRSILPKYKSKQIEYDLVCDENLELNSFPGAYAQIFTNLLLNSYTHGFYNRQHGKIGIRVHSHAGKLRIDYFDDGAGIKKNDLPHIFEPFYTTDQRRGTGLGLNIVYSQVKQKLQGNVSCLSEFGKGVHFSIELPEKFKIQTHGKGS